MNSISEVTSGVEVSTGRAKLKVAEDPAANGQTPSMRLMMQAPLAASPMSYSIVIPHSDALTLGKISVVYSSTCESPQMLKLQSTFSSPSTYVEFNFSDAIASTLNCARFLKAGIVSATKKDAIGQWNSIIAVTDWRNGKDDLNKSKQSNNSQHFSTFFSCPSMANLNFTMKSILLYSL